MTISVTADHIMSGIPGSQCFCPIALAIKDAFGPVLINVDVKDYGITIQTTNTHYYQMPSKVLHFVRRFDARLPVVSFEFELPL